MKAEEPHHTRNPDPERLARAAFDATETLDAFFPVEMWVRGQLNSTARTDFGAIAAASAFATPE